MHLFLRTMGAFYVSSKSLFVRARLAFAVAARDTADLARGVVGDISTPMVPGERIRAARRIRLKSLSLVDRAVLAELSDGATWLQVATALGSTAEDAEQRYGQTWQEWLAGVYEDDADFGDFGIGLRGDLDLEGTAATLDQWWQRHAEPWEDCAAYPVGRVLVDGDAAPRDC